jgi:hypothetical protein
MKIRKSAKAKPTAAKEAAKETAQRPSAKRPASAATKRKAAVSRPISAAPAATRRAAAAEVARRTAPADSAARQEIELEAAVLRRLLRHFDERKDVQNIELMILAGFCRNCLSKWLVEAAQERGIEVDLEQAREKIYGMPYSQWKEHHQQPASEDQLRRFAEVERRNKQAEAAAKASRKG